MSEDNGLKVPTGTSAIWRGQGPLLAAIAFLIPVTMLAVGIALAWSHALWPNPGAAGVPAAAYYSGNIGALRGAVALKGSDSWTPMLAARIWLQEHPRADVYQALFFGQHIKFQYPLSSLLFVSWVRTSGQTAIQHLNVADILAFAILLFSVTTLTIDFAKRVASPSALSQSSQIGLLVVSAIATLCFFPVIRAFYLGQIQLLLDALFTLSCLLYLRRKPTLAGVLIGLSTLIKPQMGLFLVWGLVRNERRFIAGLLITALTGIVCSMWLYGAAWPLGYLRVLSYIGVHGEAYFANQSVNGLVNRLVGNGSNLIWTPRSFAPYDSAVYFCTIVSSLAFIAAGIMFGRSARSDIGRVTSVVVAGICFTLASPIAWEHHFGILLPAFAICFVLVLMVKEAKRGLKSIFLALSFFLAANALPVLNWTSYTKFNFIQSYLFLSALLLLGLLARLTVRSSSVLTTA